MSHQATSFYNDFYPRGLRKLFAIGLICSTTLLPTVIAWKDGSESAPQAQRAYVPRFGSGHGRTNAESRSSAWLRVSIGIGRTMLAVFGGVVGLATYYPSWGFKRYALLCGPILGIGSMMFVSWYLSGRTSVYRFETVFAALAGAAPGVLLYALLARRKWQKKHAAEAIWLE